MQINIKDIELLTLSMSLLSDPAPLTSSNLGQTSGPGTRDRK